MNIRNSIRNWLGLNQELENAASRFTALERNVFEIFHALPFVGGVLALTNKDAANMTVGAFSANNTVSLLLGIIMAARQGDSWFMVEGGIEEPVRKELEHRGFKIEEQTGSGGTNLFIIWS